MTSPESRADLIAEGRRRLDAFESATPGSQEETATADSWNVWQLANGGELLDALERQERELAGYRAEERRVREWNALVNEGNVRCTWCDLRYAEREEYPCGDERDQNSHHYNADELAEARRKALDGDQ